MPKATSKTFKKKKYNARFPPARIKKIMQTDEEVGKVAAAVPVIISRSLEMFIESLILQAAKITGMKNAKTLSSSHIKQTIIAEKQYDFLRDLVKNVPDHQTEDNNGDAPLESEPTVKRGRGRPKKVDNFSKAGRKSKAEASSETSDEEEEEYNEEDEETETDEESSQTLPAPSTSQDRLQPMDNFNNSNNGVASFNHQGFSGALPVPSSSQVTPVIMPCAPYFPPYNIASPSLPSLGQPNPNLTHFMSQIPPAPQQLPINLSNSTPLAAIGTKDDDDYDS